MNDAPRMIPQEPTMNAAPKPLSAMDLIDDIHIHHDVALTLVHLVGLIGSSIGYEGDREVAINVIEREILAAADSMKELTEKLRDCLED